LWRLNFQAADELIRARLLKGLLLRVIALVPPS